MSKAFLMQAGTFLLKFMPYGLARGIALLSGDLSYLFMRERRRILWDNLSRTASRRTPAERRKLVRSTFRNFALCSIDFLKLPLMSKQEVVDLVEIYGLDHLDEALASGHGAILVTGHLGTWDFAGAFLAALGYPINAVVEDIEPETYKVFEQHREATGMKTISLERGALPCVRVLRRKELLVLVGDRAIHGQGLAVNFFSGKRVLPEGPAAFVFKTGANLVVGYMIINPKGSEKRYKGVIGPVMKPEEVGAGDEQEYTQVIADRLCEGIRDYPDQWFVFQPQWL